MKKFRFGTSVTELLTKFILKTLSKTRTIISMVRHQWIVAASLTFLSGCVVTSPKREKDNRDLVDLKQQVLELQKSQAQLKERLEEEHTKVLLLTDRLENEKSSGGPMPASVAPAPIPAAAEALGEEKIYRNAEAKWRAQDEEGLARQVDLLFKGYKDSPYTSVTLNWLGDLHYKKGNFEKALQDFQRLYRSFPDGNRAVAALFGVGLSYRKLGKTTEAQEAFHAIVRTYPGSKEALEASELIKDEAAL